MATRTRPGRERTGAPVQWAGRVSVGALISPEQRDLLLLLAETDDRSVADLIRAGLEHEAQALVDPSENDDRRELVLN